MEPKIISIDLEHPVGNLVFNYGNDRYYQGFRDGFIGGSVFTLVVVCLKDFLKT